MYYNMSNLTLANNPYEWFVAIDQLSGHWLGALIWIVLFVVMFIGLKQFNEFEESFAASSFLAAILGLLMFSMNLLRPVFALLSIVMVGIAGLMLYFRSK